MVVGKRRHSSLRVVGHSACLPSSEILSSKAPPYKYKIYANGYKYEIDVNVELYFWCVCGCVIIMYYVHVCIYVTMKAERCIDLICTRIQHFKSNTLRNH